MNTTTDSPLISHAKAELRRAGLLDKNADYGGMLGFATLDLVEKFAGQGHSGASAAIVTDLFARLARYEALTELTDDPDEWHDHGNNLWQNRRNGAAFSTDGGRTYRINGSDEVHTSATRS